MTKETAADAAQIENMQRVLGAYRRQLQEMSRRHNLAPDRWRRIDEALGELDCGLTDVLDDIGHGA